MLRARLSKRAASSYCLRAWRSTARFVRPTATLGSSAPTTCSHTDSASWKLPSSVEVNRDRCLPGGWWNGSSQRGASDWQLWGVSAVKSYGVAPNVSSESSVSTSGAARKDGWFLYSFQHRIGTKTKHDRIVLLPHLLKLLPSHCCRYPWVLVGLWVFGKAEHWAKRNGKLKWTGWEHVDPPASRRLRENWETRSSSRVSTPTLDQEWCSGPTRQTRMPYCAPSVNPPRSKDGNEPC